MKKGLIFFKDKIKKINVFLMEQEVTSFFLVFGFFVIYFFILYMKLPVLSSSDDHYFHFRFAEKLLQDGFFDSFRNFKSIYFTNVANGQYFIYYNFLFYALLLPFTLITPLFLSIKLYAIIIISLIGVIIYLFFKKIGIKYAFFWAVGFFAITGLVSFFRMFLSRPYVLAPAFILLLILAVHKKKYFYIFLLSFFYLFWHTATFLLPIFVGVIYFMIDSLYKRKYNWKLILSVVGGTLAAIIVVSLINVGFFNNIHYNVLGLLKSIFTKDGINIQEGGELYPKNFFNFLNQNTFLFVMFVLSVVFYIFEFFNEKRKMFFLGGELKEKRILTLTLFFLSLIFLFAIVNISNRFADFFVLFAWVFIALIFSDIFSCVEFNKLISKKALGCAILVCLTYLLINNSLQINDLFASSGSRPETFLKVGNYLSNNLKKDDIVFNVSWNWFPQLYYYAPDQNYVIGLEPKLVYLYDSRLYWLWQNIGNGYVCENEVCKDKEMQRNKYLKKQNLAIEWEEKEGNKIAETIINKFKSHYIVSSKNYPYLNIILSNNKNFEKVVNDTNNGLFVYKILD